jgi:TetR/AcrR family transcriptional regulator, tetracycline repressor protein
MSESGSQTEPRRGRGRVPRLTRQLIVEATAELLRSEPQVPITMGRVAQAVGASPMSLYRHFKGRDDLLMAVTRTALASHRARLPRNATWEQELAGWMRAMYEQARTYPQLIQLSLTGDAPVWLGDAADLVPVLERAGVPVERMAGALYWVATTTLGHCLVAAAAPAHQPRGRLFAALAELPDEEAVRLAPILPALPETSPEAFELVVDVMVASLVHFTAPRRAARK